ncbi:MAG: hypothetical protein NVS2B9_17560 [Myxococcales bacterium]
MTKLLCAVAAVILGGALQISDGTFDPVALALVTLAGALAVAAAVRARRPGAPASERVELLTQGVLGAGAVLGIACTLLLPPTSEAPARSLGGLRGLALAAGVLLAAYLCVHLRASLLRARFAGLVVLVAAMCAAAVQLSPHPGIDTWIFQQVGAEALARGANPYSIGYPNIYAGGLDRVFYSPELLRGGEVIVYPYPPLNLIAGTAARSLLGDVRYVAVAALAAAAACLARLGGRAGSGTASRTTAELAALFVLLQPRTLLVVEKAWTEPLVIACFSFALLGLLRWRRAAPSGAVLAGLAFGALAASKQYAPLLLLPLALASPRWDRTTAALAALVVPAVTLVPFAVWDVRELWNDLVVAQLVQPFRMDALSLLALWGRAVGATPRSLALLGFAAAGLIFLGALRRRSSALQAAVAGAAAFTWLVLLNKQAFCNYLWLAASLLAAACALPDPAPGPTVAGEALDAAGERRLPSEGRRDKHAGTRALSSDG